MSKSDHNIYRVDVSPDKGSVTLDCVGLLCADSSELGEYKSQEDLPAWVQDKLAVLLLLEPNDDCPSVGKRSSEYVFWIWKELENEDDG